MSDRVCAVCLGKESEHEGRQHIFTLNAGELKTHEQQKKEQQQIRMTPVPLAPQVMVPGSLDSVGRLVKVLLEKRIIDDAEAIYIIFGARS